ncbi:MAG: NUDIX domain-containing protein [Flavobacteriia bacterium]|jgi:8-oxo-dGTP diphosphatase
MGRFNIRIYGLLINERDQILVSDECQNGYAFTKFPGGGLELGEGFVHALIREFREELGIDIEVRELFYFNEYYQPSVFKPEDQVHSFYYHVKYADWSNIVADQHEVPLTEEGEKHRWIHLKELNIEDFTFPIDKIVVKRLLDQ